MTDPWTSGQQQPGPPPSGYPPYPPQQPYGQPPPPYAVRYPPPKKSHTTVIVLSVVGGVVVLVLAICGITVLVGGKSVHDDQIRANNDVKIVNCGTRQLFDDTTGVATIVITNSGSARASYDVDIAFEAPSGDTQYGTATAVVSDLGPHQSSTVQANGFDHVPPAGDFKCVVTSVTRI